MRVSVRSNFYSEQDACVQEAIALLSEGELVILPTETVYGIAVRADLPHAVERLMTVKQRENNSPFTLAVPSVAAIRRYVPNFSGIAERLARRCFPGPLTLVLKSEVPGTEPQPFPESVKPYIMPEGFVGLRIPDNPFTLAVLKNAGFPIALSSANISGAPPAISCDGIGISSLTNLVAMVYDAGVSPLRKSSTVLKFSDDFSNYTIKRDGAASAKLLNQMAQPLILFVDTGDTCRAPMAKMLARKLLATQFSVIVEDVESDVGIHVLSAGIFVMESCIADKMAQKAMSDVNLDLSGHLSQPVTDRLLIYADRIFCMTMDHCMNLLARTSDISSRLFLLNREDGGIVKPEGEALMQYQACAKLIAQSLEKSLFSKDMENILA